MEQVANRSLNELRFDDPASLAHTLTYKRAQLREKGRGYQILIEKPRGLEPIRTAVVHPVDGVSLIAAIEAAKERLIVPVLIGPEKKIRTAAEQTNIDLAGYEIVPTEHSAAAAAEAVALARAGKVNALMKGAALKGHTHDCDYQLRVIQHQVHTVSR